MTNLMFPPITDFADLDTMRDELTSYIHDVRATEKDLLPTPDPWPVIIGAYPRIANTIQLLWGSQQLENTFTRWLFTDQLGRKGWPVGVYEALLELGNYHRSEFGLTADTSFGGWRDTWA
jgi:hypothetical protein